MPVYTNVWQLVEAKLGHFLHCIITFCTPLYHQTQLAMRGKDEKGKEAEKKEVQKNQKEYDKKEETMEQEDQKDK